MADDLLRQHDFHGMKREEVANLIGEPEKTGHFTEWDMVYWLGPERGFMGIDSEWLVFRLNADNKIVDFRIVTD